MISESDPVCQNNMTDNEGTEGDSVEWSCKVGFKGIWAPSMEWSNATGVIKSECQNTSDSVKCTFVMRLRRTDSGQPFSCRTFFDEPRGPRPGSIEAKRANNSISTDGLFPVCKSSAITVNCKYSFCTRLLCGQVSCLYTCMCAFTGS